MLALSQAGLAEYLGIPRSNIAMAENNMRSLPADILLKIVDLQNNIKHNRADRLETLTAQVDNNFGINPEDGIYTMREDEIECNLKILRARVRLKKMSEQYNELQAVITVLEKVLEDHKEKHQYDFWKLQYYRMELKLDSCSLLRQDRLRMKIKVLEAQADYYK